jgi:hypothetical protein
VKAKHFHLVQIISDNLLVSTAKNEVLVVFCYMFKGQRKITQFQLNRYISVMMYLVPACDTTVLEDYTTPDYRDRTSL